MKILKNKVFAAFFSAVMILISIAIGYNAVYDVTSQSQGDTSLWKWPGISAPSDPRLELLILFALAIFIVIGCSVGEKKHKNKKVKPARTEQFAKNDAANQQTASSTNGTNAANNSTSNAGAYPPPPPNAGQWKRPAQPSRSEWQQTNTNKSREWKRPTPPPPPPYQNQNAPNSPPNYNTFDGAEFGKKVSDKVNEAFNPEKINKTVNTVVDNVGDVVENVVDGLLHGANSIYRRGFKPPFSDASGTQRKPPEQPNDDNFKPL